VSPVEGRLHAYLHHDVDSSWYCGKTSFVPAGSDHVERERTLADLAIESPWWENDTIELYQRGIAYVEVGRVEDAARMLEIGEGMMQWGVTRRWIDPGTGWPEHFPDQEVPRLRDRLREAIQSEARSSGP